MAEKAKKKKSPAKSLVKLGTGKHEGKKNSQAGKSGLGVGVIEEQGRILVMDHGPNSDSRGYTRAERAVKKPKPGQTVHHKNGVKTDNRASNLEVLPNVAAHNAKRAKKISKKKK